jgi:hypothetical protein
VTALRKAFDDTMKDPKFIEASKKANLTIDPLPGDQLQKVVSDVTHVSPEILARAEEFLTPLAGSQSEKKK